MVGAGYSPEEDEQLFSRVKDLLLKKNLARPPLPDVLKGERLSSPSFAHLSALARLSALCLGASVPLSLADVVAIYGHLADPHLSSTDPEMQLFEDAICLVFLSLQFVDFSDKLDDPDKMVGIVRKTWAKMTPEGQTVVASDLLPTLPQELKEVVGKALAV